MHLGSSKRYTIPMHYCIGLALSQAAMQAFSNMAMLYLNYPAKVLFKSCRVIPTMLFGVIVMKKTYSKMEWVSMILLVSGLIIFMQADMHSSPEMNPSGMILIGISLLLDAGILNIQEHCFAKFKCDEDEIVVVSYSGGSAALLALCLVTGELKSAVAFIQSPMVGSQSYAIASLAALSTCGFCGVVCVTALTRRFGALVAALTTTVRKALTLIISFTLFPNPVEYGHFFGGGIFILGIFLKATSPRTKMKKDPNAHLLIASSTSTPIIYSPNNSMDNNSSNNSSNSSIISEKTESALV
jgi:solute carrier family 35 (adenosine 3'-phospho 5'-phosphosulfate transporter), member B3